MFYVDTSVLVALHVPEPHSLDALAWLSANADAHLLCSAWGVLEFASALSRKIRSGRMPPHERPAAEYAFEVTLRESFESAAVEAIDYTIASMMLQHHETGLRSGDALHLAIADRLRAKLVTLDATMASAARFHGIEVTAIL